MQEGSIWDWIHAEKYRGPDENFREACNRQASALQDSPEHYQAYRDILTRQAFLPGGRIQSSIGSTRITTAINCFVSPNLADSMVDGQNSIMNVANMAAATMRLGGGIGYDFSTLRPSGALIKKLQSHTSGPVSFMKIFDAVCGCISSAGHRRGAQMGVLRIDHPDIEKFIHAKQNTTELRNFNISVAVTDEFMTCLTIGKPFKLKFGGDVYREVDPAALWDMLMRSTYDWAEPGILFIDRINQYNNLWYTEKITATNPCVSGDTPILTSTGFRPIQECEGKEISVWNGFEWTTVTPYITGHDRPGVYITFSDGSELTCTTNHRFALKGSQIKEASELTVDDTLEQFSFPVIENGNDLGRALPYTHGFYAGDGSHENARDRDSIWLYGEKKKLLPYLTYHSVVECAGDRLYVQLPKDDWSKTFVPGVDWSVTSRLSWLAGLSDSDGNLQYGSGDLFPALVISSVDRTFLMKVKQLCHTLGLDCSLRLMKLGGEKSMPNGRGGTQTYSCQPCYRLILTPWSVSQLIRLGFVTYRLQLPAASQRYGRKYYVKVVSVTPIGTIPTTYCFTDPIRGRGIFGCVSTPQCGEQPLGPHAACLLGSFNLTKYLAKPRSSAQYYEFDYGAFARDIPVVVRAMDNVIDRTIYPLYEQEEEHKATRRMGLGVTGLANTLEAMGYPYGSPEFLLEQGKILTILRDVAYSSSVALAHEKGPFPRFSQDYVEGRFIQTLPHDIQEAIAKYGIRNSHLLSIAPTGTISLSAGNVSSGIEPVYEYTYRRDINTPTGTKNVEISDWAYRELGVTGKTVKGGTVSVDDHLKVLATAQRFVDSAVSKTINIPHDYPWNDFKHVYVKAYDWGAKGCTTYRVGGKRESIFSEGAACTIDEHGKKTCE